MGVTGPLWWKKEIQHWVGRKALPLENRLRHGLGELYPWSVVREYSRSHQHLKRVIEARKILDEARDAQVEWALSLSGGKDSTVIAVLCAEDGWELPAVSVKDDLDFPGEHRYVNFLCSHLGLSVDILHPTVSLAKYLKEMRVSLADDLHSRVSDFSIDHFYNILARHRKLHGYDGVVLGLRAEESLGRKMNVVTKGVLYRRSDGLQVCQPLAWWTSLDVHAFLLSRRIPLLPIYMCVDDGVDPLAIRKAWWTVGGGPATRGHYAWLRRWWPDQWRVAVDIDPSVLGFS